MQNCKIHGEIFQPTRVRFIGFEPLTDAFARYYDYFLNTTWSEGACSIDISKSTFIKNWAGISGGLISYNLNPPTLADNIYKDNSADSGYGDLFDSYPVRVIVKGNSNWNSEVIVSSGKNLPSSLEVTLVDWHN